MPANAKWPDFQLASRLRYFMGSSAPESTPSQITSSPQLNEARREESPSAQDNDLEAESHARSAAMAEIDNEPIEEMGDVDDYEHEGDDTGVDVDFGDLEMFDSNASQLPFLSQEPQSLKTEEPVFPTSSESTKRDKTKKKKKKKSPLQTDEIAGDTPTEADLDAPRATLASEESIGGPDAVEDATTDMDALDLKPILSTQKKKKRKTSESADGKRHKKRKGLEDGDTNTIQQTQDENPSSQLLGVAAEDGQMSPSIALARRRSQTGEETRSRENSVPRAQVAPMAPMAIDTSAPEPAPEEASRSQEATTENHRDDRDVEDLAREAWREHVNSQSGNATAANKIEPASQDSAEAEEQPDATPRRRSARTKKPKPTLPAQALESTETPAKKSRRILEELPSPSANTPKPRARAKRATQKPRQQTEQTSEDDFENAESEKPAKRATNLEGYTQGRFTDAEFDGINRAIEAFRNEYGLTQVQINEMIQAPGGTTAGSDHARLWYRLFEACPDPRGKWTPEQDAELSALINVNGTAWSKIAAIINRHPEDVRDRYRNYIVCGANQRRDVWNEDEEARLTEYVKEAMEVIDELRRDSPQTALLRKSYEELIDWQNISEKMERTRSRLQCITKWKAMQNRISGKKKERKNPEAKKQKSHLQPEVVISDEDISSQLDQARQQMMSMREEDQYRLVLAIQGASVLLDDQIPWAKLLDKKFRNQWSRGTQILLWDRLKQTVPDWEAISVLDVAQYIINEYNRTGSLPEVTGSGYDDDEREKELLGYTRSRSKPTAVVKSAEFVEDSGAEDEHRDSGQQNQDDKLEITIDPALMGETPLSPPSATPKQKKATQKKPRAKKSKKVSLSQDPIEDSEPILPPNTVDEGEESNLDEAQLRKSKTPSKFKSVNTTHEENGVAASQEEPYSDSIMDDMEDLPARILT
ncbi:RNA polymerase I termination factor [Trichoderma asperellum]|uniref:RNA polymerase I termination factor n=1 Tax=Trichoderma asperellum TaxID=101201 RepID=A0A6V8QQ68_TRIAP|nr:RNA polymerase I termination factor [Trichoderma asperellum]